MSLATNHSFNQSINHSINHLKHFSNVFKFYFKRKFFQVSILIYFISKFGLSLYILPRHVSFVCDDSGHGYLIYYILHRFDLLFMHCHGKFQI